MTRKEEFIQICKDNIKSRDLTGLFSWLEKSDFYTAPASTKYHGNFEEGLLQHSLNVYHNLTKLCDTYFPDKFNKETLTIISLFHDICKANFYKLGTRNVKGEDGKWFAKPVYEIDEQVPLGHGEKSCLILQQFIRLSLEETLAIRWHMGGFDCATKGGDYGMSKAQELTPLVTLLQVTDMLSTLFEEKVD